MHLPTERTPGLPPLQLNVSRWSQLFRKLGVVKGDDIVSEVHRQIFPVIVVEDDRPEHKLLAGERLAWGQYLLAAGGAGVTGYVGLQNPAASGIIVVVESIRAFTINGTFNRHYLGLARGATVTARSTEQPRDTRWQPTGAFGVGAPNIAGQVVSALSTTIGVLPFVVAEWLPAILAGAATQTAAAVEAWREPVILGPGDQLFVWQSDGVGGSATNLAQQASFVWRERATEPGETA
jgi:hypothetical protein